MRGTVSFYDKVKGWGFIRAEDGTKIFVYWTSLNMEGFKSLKPGQTVTFDVIDTEKGKQAVNVTVIEEGKEDK